MAKIKFTVSSLHSAFKADDVKDRQAVVWDTEMRGLGAYKGASGTGTFFVQFRVGDRQRKVTLGRLNELTVPEARRQAGEIIVAARQGRDIVAQQKQAQRKTLTLKEAYNEYTLALRRRNASWNTLRLNEANWRRMLEPLGNRELRHITKRDLRAWHTNWGQVGPRAANMGAQLFRAIWNYAAKFSDDLPPNPSTAVEYFPEREQRRIIAWPELPEWWRRTDGLPNPIRRVYWRFLLFSGLRKMDALTIRWEDVREGHIHRPNPKGGRIRAFDMPLTDQLRKLLEEARTAGEALYPGSPWVFPAEGKRGHMIAACEKSFPGVTPHDLRRTYATACAEAGVDPYTIKLLLNHAIDKGDVTQRYIKPSREHFERSARLVANFLDGRVAGTGSLVAQGR